MKFSSFLVLVFKLQLFICYFSIVSTKSQLKDLNETTWVQMLEGEWFIQFYAPWCPACKQLAPIWKEFAEWSEDLSIQVGQVDVTTNPGLSGRFMITALPTVYHAKDGVFRLYTGARDKDALFSFIEEKKWIKVNPVSSWGSPQSFSMTTVAYFFRLSMTLRDMHNYLTSELNFHSWTAHICFGIATVFTGILLGLLIVAFIDCMYSVKRWISKSDSQKDDYAHDNNEENNDMQPLSEENLEDENVDEDEEPEDEREKIIDYGGGDEKFGVDKHCSDSDSDIQFSNVADSSSEIVHRKGKSSSLD